MSDLAFEPAQVDLKVLTVGHGTLPREDFAGLVQGAGVAEVVDVRSFPGSRCNPQFGAEEMARWLPAADLAYSWIADLGGRRRAVPGSRQIALRHPSFQAYADYMETDQFVDGVEELLARGDGRAVMCSESVWCVATVASSPTTSSSSEVCGSCTSCTMAGSRHTGRPKASAVTGAVWSTTSG